MDSFRLRTLSRTGCATMGNKVLREERKLTAEHIRKLSAHFSLQAEYFL